MGPSRQPAERKKTTVYIDGDLWAAVRVLSAGSGKRDYEVLEEALRLYLQRPEGVSGRQGVIDLLNRIAEHSDNRLNDDSALDIAYEELKKQRRSKRSVSAAQ